jgi:signal transduction histidine kinase
MRTHPPAGLRAAGLEAGDPVLAQQRVVVTDQAGHGTTAVGIAAIAASAVAFIRAANAAEEMEARARQFVGDVSHELRTPLTAMTAGQRDPDWTST